MRKLLTQVSEDAKNILRLVMHYDSIEAQQLFKIQGLSLDALQKVLQECKSADLLIVEYGSFDASSMTAFVHMKVVYQVRQEFRETLKRLLYSEKQKAD